MTMDPGLIPMPPALARVAAARVAAAPVAAAPVECAESARSFFAVKNTMTLSQVASEIGISTKGFSAMCKTVAKSASHKDKSWLSKVSTNGHLKLNPTDANGEKVPFPWPNHTEFTTAAMVYGSDRFGELFEGFEHV